MTGARSYATLSRQEAAPQKAAIYCRLSEEDRHKPLMTDDSGSIQNQKAMLLQYAMEQGWEVYDIYSDDDYAGADRNRPAFNRLLQAARQRKFNVVLCKTQSRFTRELELVEKYIHGLFPLWGIRFVSIVDNADTANKGNKKARQINGLVNEWYLEDLSENIRSVLTHRRENGFHIGSFALYGYKKDPAQKGHLVIDDEAAAIVRQVFTLFSQGYGKTAIARMLNDQGIPNPTEYKRLHGLRYQQPQQKVSTLWKYSAISDMLENELYIGNMVQGRYGSVSYKTKQNRPRPESQWYRVEGTHEPIISPELWETVAALRQQRAKPFAGGAIGIFARKVRCMNCGGTMRSSKSRGKHYLKCPNHHVAKDACIGSFISVDRLEQFILAELERLNAIYLDKEELARKIAPCQDLNRKKSRQAADLATCKEKIDGYKKALQKVYLDRASGLLSESDYVDLSKSFSAERERLERIAATQGKYLAELNARLEIGSDCEQLVEQYTHPEHLSREMVDALIDHISVGKRICGTKALPIEIYWNF